jgi:Flp pilus assembly pilin Flp
MLSEQSVNLPERHTRAEAIPAGVAPCFPFNFWYKEFGMKKMFAEFFKKRAARLWNEDDGVLSFEWVLLVTLLTIGIVSGLSAARDAIIDELGDVAQAMVSLDQSYTIDFPLNVDVHTVDATSASDSLFIDALTYTDCGRTNVSGPTPPTQLLNGDGNLDRDS